MSESNLVKTLSDQNFQSVVDKGDLLLVDFWAEWCAPCKAMSPILDEIAQDLEGKVSIYKLNIDDNPQTPANFGVRGIPTLILYKGGEAIDQIVGVMPKDQIKAKISEHIS